VVERVARPTVREFTELRRAAVPVVLEGLLDDWPARQNWTLARLRARFGDRLVPVISTTDGRLVTDVRAGVEFRSIRFGEYLDRLESGVRPDAYLIAHGDTWLPELQDDIRVPAYCCTSWKTTRFWLSAAQTAAPLHRDVAENIFCQFFGRKRFYLYPPSFTPWLYSNPFLSGLPNYSRFDPERADYERFPLAGEVRPIELLVEPGDAVYLPSRWWHQVRSLELSVSFNIWWAKGALAFAVRSAEFVKKLRGLEIYGLEARLRASGALGGERSA
jgi:lysine-specific demethylase 8